MGKEKGVLVVGGLSLAAFLTYLFTRKAKAEEPPPECIVEDETKCFGNDLYQCIGGEWVLVEANSLECGYVPPPPPPTGGYIEGIVYSGGERIPDVEVLGIDLQSEATWSTFTDGNGYYLLDGLPVPEDGSSLYLKIIYSKTGYIAAEITTTLNQTHPNRYKNVTLTESGEPPPPPPPPPPPECTEGDTECRGYDLYECIGGEWVLAEADSLACGYVPPVDPMNGVIEGTVTMNGVGLDNVQIIIQKYPEPDQYNVGDTRCSGHHLYEYQGGAQWNLVEADSPQCVVGSPEDWVAYTDANGNFMVSGLPVVSNWESLKYRAFYTLWIYKEGYQCRGDAPDQKSVALSISQPSVNVSLTCK